LLSRGRKSAWRSSLSSIFRILHSRNKRVISLSQNLHTIGCGKYPYSARMSHSKKIQIDCQSLHSWPNLTAYFVSCHWGKARSFNWHRTFIGILYADNINIDNVEQRCIIKFLWKEGADAHEIQQ
jgi:hypothetical protein